MSITKDEDLELHSQRGHNFCFVGFKAWQGNTDIQPVLMKVSQ